MTPPFNTGKVLIGSNYRPQHVWTPTRAEAVLQDALLTKQPTGIDWDGMGIIAGSVALALVGWVVGGLL